MSNDTKQWVTDHTKRYMRWGYVNGPVWEGVALATIYFSLRDTPGFTDTHPYKVSVTGITKQAQFATLEEAMLYGESKN